MNAQKREDPTMPIDVSNFNRSTLTDLLLATQEDNIALTLKLNELMDNIDMIAVLEDELTMEKLIEIRNKSRRIVQMQSHDFLAQDESLDYGNAHFDGRNFYVPGKQPVEVLAPYSVGGIPAADLEKQAIEDGIASIFEEQD
jgi:hypothetical protein